MGTSDFLIPMLTIIGYRLPSLVACGIGFALLASSARPGIARSRGYLGLGLTLACLLIGLALALYQSWLINQAYANGGMSHAQLGVIGVLQLIVECVGSAGLVVLVVGLCRASRDAAAENLQQPPAFPERRAVDGRSETH